MLSERTDNRPRPTVERWLCRSCHAMLGEVTETTVVVRLGTRSGAKYPRVITAPVPCSQTCPECGTHNVRQEV